MALVRQSARKPLVKAEEHALATYTEREEAYGRIYDLLFERLCRFAERFLDADDAHDAVQNTLVRIWLSWNIIAPEQPGVTYFFRAVRNEILNVRRTKTRQSAVLEAAPAGTLHRYRKSATDADLERAELAAIIEATLARMPERCREAWVLIRENEFTYAQAAQAMEVDSGTPKKYMTRANALLREAITDAGYLEAARRKQLPPGDPPGDQS